MRLLVEAEINSDCTDVLASSGALRKAGVVGPVEIDDDGLPLSVVAGGTVAGTKFVGVHRADLVSQAPSVDETKLREPSQWTIGAGRSQFPEMPPSENGYSRDCAASTA